MTTTLIVLAHPDRRSVNGVRAEATEAWLSVTQCSGPTLAPCAVLADQSRLMRAFDHHPRMRFNSDDDFNTDGRLKPGAESHSPVIRHAP